MSTLHVSSPTEPLARFVYPLANVTVSESEDARFACQVVPSDAAAKWFIDGIEIYESEKYEIEARDHIRALVIHRASLWDEGSISVVVEGVVSEAVLSVQGRIHFHTLWKPLRLDLLIAINVLKNDT